MIVAKKGYENEKIKYFIVDRNIICWMSAIKGNR